MPLTATELIFRLAGSPLVYGGHTNFSVYLLSSPRAAHEEAGPRRDVPSAVSRNVGVVIVSCGRWSLTRPSVWSRSPGPRGTVSDCGTFPGSTIPRGSRGHWRPFSADRVEQQRRGHRRPVGADRAGHGGRSCAGLRGQGRAERG